MSDVTIYWRPGCVFCMRLENALRASRNKATWRNIWEDDEAREFVAMVNDGNEVVPTVVIDGHADELGGELEQAGAAIGFAL